MCVSSTTYIYDKSTVVTASNFGKLGMLMSPEAKNKHEGLFYCCIKKKTTLKLYPILLSFTVDTN